MSTETPQRQTNFDPDTLREKYREERDKRLRADGNDQYVEVVDQFARFLEDPFADRDFDREPLTDEVDVVIIGGGFGGLLTGAYLRKAGFDDIRFVEKGADFGGTWYWNRYPGAQCDIESYIYMPLLEDLGYMPKEKYSFGEEILAYTQALAKKFDLYRDACFQTGVTETRWDERGTAVDRFDRPRRPHARPIRRPVHWRPQPAEAASRQRDRPVQGSHLPHEPVGLRVHGRRPRWWPDRAP